MTERSKRLQEIQEVSFTLDELTLYLDTHPLDEDALNAFETAQKKRKELLSEYARDFEPLTRDCVCVGSSDSDFAKTANNQTNSYCKYPNRRHFTWSDGPLPWDNQGGV